MGLRNSEIIICRNIKLDKDYKNVLSYTESEMLTLCRQNAVASASDYSFIRKERGYIKTSFSYTDALKCNYLAFQNKDYSNKWFFAFIDDIEYLSDGTCAINYTVDIFSTWWDYWVQEPCLVLREHVLSDNIGEHTYPENLEHGPYMCNSYTEVGGYDVEQCYRVVATTWLPTNTPGLTPTQYYGGVFSGVYMIAFPTNTDATNFLLAIDGLGRASSIVAVFMAPANLCVPNTPFQADLKSKANNMNGTVVDKTYHIEALFIGNNNGVMSDYGDITVSINNTLNGYTPKNKKLYSWPYNYLLVTNHVGSNAEFHYEDFIGNSPIFNLIGVLSVGCSIKLYPKNYNLIADDNTTHPGFNSGILAAKFPICSYKSDSFVNWMTQQSVNRTMAKVGAAARIIAMTQQELGGDDTQYASLFRQQANYVSEVYEHSLVAPQAMGSLNAAEVTFARNEQNFGFYKMSIKSEYARKIDAYFNKFGYQVNEIKLAEQITRPYWNFVQIGPYENIGYPNNNNVSVPANDMENINKIYRSGVTIWHDHDALGNYNLNNYLQ